MAGKQKPRIYNDDNSDDDFSVELPVAPPGVSGVICVVTKPQEDHHDPRFTRHIGSFHVRDKITKKMVHSFDEANPLVLTVIVKDGDDPNALCYLNAKTDELVRFKDQVPSTVKSYELDYLDNPQLVIVKILEWGDPNIGYGGG